MRKACSDYGIIVIDGKFIGISLGYDFAAEHEWGIDNIKTRFGMPELTKKTLGITARSITKNIDTLIFKKQTYKKQKFALLYTGYEYRTLEDSKKYVPRDLENYKQDIIWRKDYDERHPPKEGKENDPVVTAWSDEGFGVGVMGEKEVDYLNDLYNAFINKNVTITYINTMPDNPFSNSALCLLIKDRIPQNFIDSMYNADKKHQDLIDYEKKIGMTKIKERYGNKNDYNGHGYYIACSAEWVDYDDEENRKKIKEKYNTKYDIIYWINYSDDDDDTHGRFSVEDIKKWLTGKKKLSEIRKANEVKHNNI